jgi:hypothetical protein
MDAVKAYRQRRDARLKARFDEEDGRWVTTENDHTVHINEKGVPDKGNPYVIDVMNGRKSEGGKSTWDEVADLPDPSAKRKYFRDKKDVSNESGASDKAVSFIKEAMRVIGDGTNEEILINEERDASPVDKKLEKELKRLAKENGMYLEFKTVSKKHSKLRGYSPIAGGGAIKSEWVEKKRVMSAFPAFKIG